MQTLHRFSTLLLSLGIVALAGCGVGTLATSVAPGSSTQIGGLTGKVYGGQQPIVGAHVYLFAAGTSGYGTASTSLLNAATTGNSDSIGAYVPTGPGGSFSLRRVLMPAPQARRCICMRWAAIQAAV